MQALARVHLIQQDIISDQVREFLLDREARGLSPHTITWYDQQLGHLRAFLLGQGISSVEEVTPAILRAFLRDFAQSHNPGGTHGAYRAAHAFFTWWSQEYETPNPIARVAAPKVAERVLDPVNPDHLKAMLATCERRTLIGERDKALMLFMLDSGCRRAELLALNIRDVDLRTGTVMVLHGKGDKPRMAFVGPKTLKALVAYLRHRPEAADSDPLWLDERGHRLSATALRAILVRRAKLAGVPAPTPHQFRRGFALAALRNGCDLISLQRLMGHSDLSVLRRYLAQTEADLSAAHRRASPVDALLDGRR